MLPIADGIWICYTMRVQRYCTSAPDAEKNPSGVSLFSQDFHKKDGEILSKNYIFCQKFFLKTLCNSVIICAKTYKTLLICGVLTKYTFFGIIPKTQKTPLLSRNPCVIIPKPCLKRFLQRVQKSVSQEFHKGKKRCNMAYLPKSMVEKNIKARVRKDKKGNPHTDYEAYVGIDPFSGKPIRITRATEKDLSKALADFYARHRTGGDAAVRLSAAQAIDAKNAYDILASAGMSSVSLFEAVSAYVNGKSIDNKNLSTTVEEAYNDYLQRRFNYFEGKTYGLNEHNEAKNVIASLGKWVGLFGDEKISAITTKSVLDYFESNYKNKRTKTYNHYLQYFKSFFNWCCKEEVAYLTKSPIKTLAYKPEAWEEPKYMKPEDVLALFRLLERHKSEHPEYLAYSIVSFFCGCRAIEIKRMASDPDAAKINLEEEFVRVVKAKGYQNGKIPRAFQLHPTAVKWINSFDFGSALSKVNGTKTQIEFYKFAESNGIPIFRNCGRHTFITYHVAAYGNPAITQAMVGTGVKMMANNYRGLATKKDGEAFFNILPSC